MKRLLPLSISLVLLSLPFTDEAGTFMAAQEKPAAAPPLKIANLKDSSVIDGCGCYLQFPAEGQKRFEKYVFMADIDEKEAWMNIEGRDVKLRLVDSIRDANRRVKVGDRSSRTYRAGDITVRVAYVVTRVCKPDDESCESTDYDATISVTKGDRRGQVKARGSCGC